MHVRCPDRLPEETYRQVLEQLADLSPVVQALPPSAALVELAGALRYHGVGGRRPAAGGGAAGAHGLPPRCPTCASGSGRPSRSRPPPLPRFHLLAVSWPSTPGTSPTGSVRCRSTPCTASVRGRPRCCASTAFTASVCSPPSRPATVHRLLGGKAGRIAADRARGIDPCPVVPRLLPASVTVRTTFPRHTLDGAPVRAALLDLVVQLGHVLRRRGQAPAA